MTGYTAIITDDNIHGAIAQQFDSMEDAEAFGDNILNTAGTWVDLEDGAVLFNEPEVSIMPTGEAEALGFLHD